MTEETGATTAGRSRHDHSLSCSEGDGMDSTTPSPGNRRTPGPRRWTPQQVTCRAPAHGGEEEDCDDDVQQLLVIKEDVSPEWSPDLDQQDQEPVRIKEEQEGFWISPEGEQLKGLDEADVAEFPFIAVTVKSEYEEEEPQSPQLHHTSSSATQIKTETDAEDCGGGSEPARNTDPDHQPQPNPVDEKTSDSCETEVSNDDWQEPLSDYGPEAKDSDGETRTSESAANALKNKKVPVGDEGRNAVRKPFSFFDCTKRFYYSGFLLRHMIFHFGKRSSRGLISEKRFRVKQKKDSQTRVHTEERPFGCDVCEKSFNRKAHLKMHKRVHTGEKPFGCDVCGKKFNRNAHLKRHMRVHKGEKPFECAFCGKKFNEQTNLKRHVQVHTGEKPFGCDECGKRFNRNAHLKRHMRVHMGDRAFGCYVCGRKFNEQTNLKRHMQVHTGEKPFGCDVCGKRFNTQADLKRHIRIHTGEKPFSCDFCGKRFNEQIALKRHLRVHTGEKPFKCDVCGQSYKHQTYLKTHLRVHTGEKPFSCEVCGQRFTQQGSVKRHMKVHTG